MSRYEVAQLNIAAMKASYESPVMADFVANLDRIHALAEDAPGFVWRMKSGEEGETTRPMEPLTLVNITVWRDVETLSEFTYRTAHAEIVRRRGEWFERMEQAYYVLWWVPKGHRPGVDEALDRLELLRANGPTPAAFTFRRTFLPPE